MNRTESLQIKSKILSFRSNMLETVLSDNNNNNYNINNSTISMNDLITVYLPFYNFISSYFIPRSNYNNRVTSLPISSETDSDQIEDIMEY